MSDIHEIELENRARIDEAVENFLGPLLQIQTLKRDAFEQLDAAVRLMVKQLKGQQLLPRYLLHAVHSTAQHCRNEAPYFKGETKTLEEMAARLDYSLGLILCGESHEDRTPGVPRII